MNFRNHVTMSFIASLSLLCAVGCASETDIELCTVDGEEIPCTFAEEGEVGQSSEAIYSHSSNPYAPCTTDGVTGTGVDCIPRVLPAKLDNSDNGCGLACVCRDKPGLECKWSWATLSLTCCDCDCIDVPVCRGYAKPSFCPSTATTGSGGGTGSGSGSGSGSSQPPDDNLPPEHQN